MIKSYLITTFRNFLRNKNYTLINIIGLSIGITSCIIIFLLVTYDLAFDKFHSKYNRIYRVVHHSENASGVDLNGVTPYPFTKAFRNDFPEISQLTQLHDEGEALLTIGAERLLVEKILFADSMFFEVFDFKVISGNPRKDLGEPGKAFLTKSLAEKIMKDGGKTTIKIANEVEVEVVGIIEDAPKDSHIQFSMIVSMPSLNSALVGGLPLEQWGLNHAGFNYLVLPSTVDELTIEERFKSFVKKYYPENNDNTETYLLQPLSDVHFNTSYASSESMVQSVDVNNMIILSALGIFILLVACVNFINLATALAVKKSKEIGVRKTLGAKRLQLSLAFVSETAIITLFALLLSLGVVEWILPWLSTFIEKELSMNLFSNVVLLSFLSGLVIIVTLLSGFYPSMILSGFNPVDVLKSKITTHRTSGTSVRKILVVFQFLIAQVLIIGTIIVSDQMDYFRNKPLGFASEAIVNVDLPTNKQQQLDAFRSRLEANADIQIVSYSMGAPTSSDGLNTSLFLSEKGDTETFDVSIKVADRNYLEAYGLKLKAGRWFTESEEKLSSPPLKWEERQYVIVVNETAARTLGFNDINEIIGKKLTVGLNNISAPVIGVVADFNTKSLHEKISPVALMNFPYFYTSAGIKINPSKLPETLSFIEKTFTEIYPEYYYNYQFLDDHLSGLYQQEERIFTLFKVFAGVSIFIGCLGLYGLIAFMANQKLKEVGIRKVLGASVASIVMLFSREFVKLIVVAFIIAAPIAWYFMNEWLQRFAYHIDIHWSVFIIGIAITLIIALLTVGYRSIRAAISNPTETLRSE